MDINMILIVFWVHFRSYPDIFPFCHDFSWFLGFRIILMVPTEYLNQQFGRFPGFSWENDLFFRIHHGRIDSVQKYLSSISLLSPTCQYP